MLSLLLYFMTSRSNSKQVPGELLVLVGISVVLSDMALVCITPPVICTMVEIFFK